MIRRALLLAAAAAWLGAVGPSGEVEASGDGVGESVSPHDVAADAPTIAAALDTLDASLGALAAEILSAEAREREALIGLLVQRDDLSRLLALMQSRSASAEQSRRLHPDGPLGAARAEGMLQAMDAPMRQQAASLRATLDEITAAKAAQTRGRDALGTGLAERARLGDLLTAEIRAEAAASGVEPPSASLAEALRDSATLEELSAAVPRASVANAAAPGSLARPLSASEVVLAFREPDGAGARRPGLLLGALPRAPVWSPASGIVRYAGPFLDYGRILVLDADTGARVVVAGLPDVLVKTGERISRGALIGALGGRSLNLEEHLALTSGITRAGAAETLYVEVDDGQGPVDPGPWFDAEDG